MSLKMWLVFGALTTAITAKAFAMPPCDFKGLAVGEVLSPTAIMRHFGITSYWKNAKINLAEHPELYKKYGIEGALDELNFKTGPYCTDDFCEIPYGIRVGIDMPAAVSVSFDKKTNVVQAIDVYVDELNWKDLKLILFQKYGRPWRRETQSMLIIDHQTNEHFFVPRETITRKDLGEDPRTNRMCEIWASQYDQVYEHPTPPGPMQSVVEIKLISKNF